MEFIALGRSFPVAILVVGAPSQSKNQTKNFTIQSKQKLSIVSQVQAKLVVPGAYPLKRLKFRFLEIQFGALLENNRRLL